MTETRTYSLAESATIIGCTEIWLSRQLTTRRLPGYKAARKWRMTAADIEEAIDICREPVTRTTVQSVGRPRRVRWAKT